MPAESRRAKASDRRTWHGAAFIVEALVLLAFLMASLAVLVGLMGSAHERGSAADELSCATILAANDAEKFAADPAAPHDAERFASVDGSLVKLGDGNAEDGTPVYELVRIVTPRTQEAGTLYEARILVSCDGKPVYELSTSRYASNEGVAR